MLGVRDACLNLALWTRAMVAITRLLDGGTQCMSLSAANVQTRCSSSMPVPYSIVLIMECAPIHHRRTVEVDCM